MRVVVVTCILVSTRFLSDLHVLSLASPLVHPAFQPVREAVSYRGLFTASWFGVREKHCSRLEIYDRLRASEQAVRRRVHWRSALVPDAPCPRPLPCCRPVRGARRHQWRLCARPADRLGCPGGWLPPARGWPGSVELCRSAVAM